MDIGTFRGLITAVLMLLFIGLVVWAFSRRRRDDFEAAARMPLDEDPEPRRGDSKTGHGADEAASGASGTTHGGSAAGRRASETKGS